jgi:sec-independent protein translocase protein TatA
MIGGLGWQELLIVLVIIALIFGASRVADLGGALGRGIREFRQEARSDDEPAGGSEPQAEASNETTPAATSENAEVSGDGERSG